MAKKKIGDKEPNRPPYVIATTPTEIVADGLEHDHAWIPGPLRLLERIQHRTWYCNTGTCDALGLSVELVEKKTS